MEKLEKLKLELEKRTSFPDISTNKDVNEWADILSKIAWLIASDKKLSIKEKIDLSGFYEACSESIKSHLYLEKFIEKTTKESIGEA